ncbi:hypothetical protein [Streptomyces agglomeratus]|uniref:hypothetical protein n=1 Tax=Streptomyces agglomeratus TaxID=285458 RepID=UPI001428AB1B|nr:hypothetical protein [Streptomyces agglomeratus]
MTYLGDDLMARVEGLLRAKIRGDLDRDRRRANRRLALALSGYAVLGVLLFFAPYLWLR